MMKNIQISASLLGVTAVIAIVQPAYAKLSVAEIANIAERITVWLEGQGEPGSAVIIKQDGDLYTILTAYHVVKDTRPQEEAYVTTFDKKRHRLDSRSIRRLGNFDLAIATFRSSNNYQVAKLGDSNRLRTGIDIYVSGFPKATETITGGIFNFLSGRVISRLPDPNKEGYQIVYDNNTKSGMSGGSVLNDNGELVGIHGLAEGERVRNSTSPVKTGRNLGIPSTLFAGQFVADVQQSAIANNPAAKINRPAPNMLSLNGQVISATLNAEDSALPDRSYYKAYQFQGQAGQSIVIEMGSANIDPYLVLFDGRGRKVAEDDDGGGGKNARIAINLPSTGRYTLYANSYEVGKTGSFTLSGIVNNNLNNNFTAESNGDRRILLERNGVLGTASQIFSRDGSLFEAFSFSGQAGQIVEIDLSSNDFHPYLVLFAPDSKVIKENNGLPSRRNASITIQLPVTGTYRVIVNAFDRSGKGAYKLIVKTVR